MKVGIPAVFMMLFSFSIQANESVSPVSSMQESSRQLSMADAVLLAFEHDPAVARIAAEIGISSAQADEAQSAWRPQVSLQGGPGASGGDSGDFGRAGSYGLKLSQMLYDFGRTSTTVDRFSAMQDSKRYELQSALNDLATRTARVYIEIKRFEDLKLVVGEGIDSLNEVRRIAMLRAEGGLSTSSDLLQTESRIAALQSQLAQYDAQLASSRAELAVLVGSQVGALGDVPDVLGEVRADIDAIDYEQIPSVLQARTMADAAQLGVEIERKGYMPTLRLEGGRTYYNTDDSYWDNTVQLTVNAPLYQGGSVGARIRQAEGSAAVSEADVNQAMQDVLLDASQAKANMKGAEGRLTAAEQQLNSSMRSRAVYRDEYLLGQRSVNDLLIAEQGVYQAKDELQNAHFDQWQSLIAYRSTIYQVLPMLGLKEEQNIAGL